MYCAKYHFIKLRHTNILFYVALPFHLDIWTKNKLILLPNRPNMFGKSLKERIYIIRHINHNNDCCLFLIAWWKGIPGEYLFHENVPMSAAKCWPICPSLNMFTKYGLPIPIINIYLTKHAWAILSTDTKCDERATFDKHLPCISLSSVLGILPTLNHGSSLRYCAVIDTFDYVKFIYGYFDFE